MLLKLKMKNILVICRIIIPGKRDVCELSRRFFSDEYNFLFYTYNNNNSDPGQNWFFETSNPDSVIDEIVQLCKEKQIDAVIATEDYPGSLIAAIVAQKANLIGPNPEHLLLCQHKYYSRLAQQEYIPEAAPKFTLIDPINFDEENFTMQLPVFLKPVKSVYSVFADKVSTLQDLIEYVDISHLSKNFLPQFNWFLQNYSPFKKSANYLIAEGLLTGQQVTLDGYVFQGNVHTLGVVDSIMFPNKISFSRFVYPSRLPETVQQRMAAIARKFIAGIGLDNALFNIEFMYNSETNEIHIIEVNPRMASQFADLYDKVDGVNLYSILIDIALGKQPAIVRNQGPHNFAASLVLRIFENKKVANAPKQKEFDQLKTEFPDSRVYTYVQEGEKLSDAFQDGKSFRYGLVHLGGKSEQDLLNKFERCKEILNFQFVDIK